MRKQTRGYKQIILSIPEEVYKKVSHIIKVRGIGLKEYLVDFLKKGVTVERKIDYSKDSIWNIVGLGRSKERDISIKHDKYLYGTVKK